MRKKNLKYRNTKIMWLLTLDVGWYDGWWLNWCEVGWLDVSVDIEGGIVCIVIGCVETLGAIDGVALSISVALGLLEGVGDGWGTDRMDWDADGIDDIVLDGCDHYIWYSDVNCCLIWYCCVSPMSKTIQFKQRENWWYCYIIYLNRSIICNAKKIRRHQPVNSPDIM